MTIDLDASGFEIFFEHAAARALDAVPKADFVSVDEAICSLNQSPRPQGCVQLSKNVFRIRSGNWQIIYLVDDSQRRVVVSAIKRRNERTYG